MEFFATCPMGFEQLLAGELRGMGLSQVRALRGQVAFAGGLADAYRACLWSRMASRVVLVLAHVDARDADALHAGLMEVAWEDHLPLDASFAVDAHGTNESLRNTQFVSLRAKDAICDRMQARLAGRPRVDVASPDVRVVVRLRGGRATCGIDLSGAPLFRRGYASAAIDVAPMRADYAAALLAAGGWYRFCRHDEPAITCLFDAAGTMLTEAAAQALDRAPGLVRPAWGFERWLGHDARAWDELLAEADARAECGAARSAALVLRADDVRGGMSRHARATLRAAGLDVALVGCDDPTGAHAPTLLAVDLCAFREGSEALEVSALGLLGTHVRGLPSDSSVAVLARDASVDAVTGLAPAQVVGTVVGRDPATIRSYGPLGAAAGDKTAAAPQRPSVALRDGTRVPVLVAASDQFAARLAKVARQRAKWARREDVSCYRVYDADLPDYAVAIDLYQGSRQMGDEAGERWLVVAEYAAPKGVDAGLAHRRLLDVLAIAPRVLSVDPANVTLRVRRQARGGSQYADGGAPDGAARTRRPDRSRDRLAPGAHLVDEGGLVFEVNLTERLDTGLFLDHRDVRARIRELAKGMRGSKRFCNLFAYTGTATCYAADGAAGHTTTVDLSRTYLDWARRNMRRNGFDGREHEYVQADVLAWVTEQRHGRSRWDLIFVDPPTFSNSRRMRSASFDVQRDHAELLIGVSRLLTRDGLAVFSCNLRGFAPDTDKLARAGVELEDITPSTIPEDFSRNAKIHHCYIVRRVR